jgi:hypothetical protein
MICHVCNKLIIGYFVKDDPDYYIRDCIEDDLYTTFYKDKLNGYVVHWKDPRDILYKITSTKTSAETSLTEIHTVEMRSPSYSFSNYEEIETLIFSTKAFFDLPMEDDKPRPDLLIPRLLKLRAFA